MANVTCPVCSAATQVVSTQAIGGRDFFLGGCGHFMDISTTGSITTPSAADLVILTNALPNEPAVTTEIADT